MIFCYSGTGNSLYAARKLSELTCDSRIIDIASAHKNREYEYFPGENEKIGFVFPVYYSGLPKTVTDFLSSLIIKPQPSAYIYGVVTCGASKGGAGYALKIALSEKWLFLSASYELVMPDNYVVMYEPCGEEKAAGILSAAQKNLGKIAGDINALCKNEEKLTFTSTLSYDFMQILYSQMRNTKKFYVNSDCIGCAQCAEICPSSAIEMKLSSPVWVKEKCDHCTACINRCPQRAIQYGKKTEKRSRYVNNILKGVK